MPQGGPAPPVLLKLCRAAGPLWLNFGVAAAFWGRQLPQWKIVVLLLHQRRPAPLEVENLYCNCGGRRHQTIIEFVPHDNVKLSRCTHEQLVMSSNDPMHITLNNDVELRERKWTQQ